MKHPSLFTKIRNFPWDELEKIVITLTEIIIAVVAAIEAIRRLKTRDTDMEES